MGFHVEINSILRSDDYDQLMKGAVYPFHKTGSRVFFDDIPVWLTKRDWTALAEIHILNQRRTRGELRGEFVVLHVFEGAERDSVTAMFRRMYSDRGDRFFYVLMTRSDFNESVKTGFFRPPSLATEGFVHASPTTQLTRIANKYYRGKGEIRVCIIDKTKVQPEVKWELRPGTIEIYPHIYGPLNMDAMHASVPVHPEADGSIEITAEAIRQD